MMWKMKEKITGIIICTFLIAGPVFSVAGTLNLDKTLNVKTNDCNNLIQQANKGDLTLDGWLEQAKLLASDGDHGDHFGCSVSISEDYAIVGAYHDDSATGSAYVFKRTGTTWTEADKLTASDGAIGDCFGFSVSIDGDYAIVGAYEDDDKGETSGSAYIFQKTNEGWVQQAKLLPSDGKEDDWFGWSVVINGDIAIIGARQNWLGEGSGMVYVFQNISGSWVQQAKLVPSDGTDGDCFGDSVAVSGDTLIIGAVGDDPSGSAYIFQKTKDGWVEQAKLVPSDGANGDHFGGSVSISDDTIIIGAAGDDDNDELSGSAYIFQNISGDWVEQAKLRASDGNYGDNFGFSVSISGDTTFIGARQDHDNVGGTGSAYIFKKTDEGWVQQAKQWASDGDGLYFFFGGSVSISGNTAIIGASGDDDNGDYSGSAYVFKKVGPNQPPNKPDIEGPTNGKTRTDYTYCINVTDPDEDSLYVFWDWGDGYTTGWLGSYENGEEICKTYWWLKKGTYIIKATLRDQYGAMATGSLEVIMPKNKPFNINLLFLRFWSNTHTCS